MILVQLAGARRRDADPALPGTARTRGRARPPLRRAGRVSRRTSRARRSCRSAPAYSLRQQVAELCEMMGARLRSDYEGTSLDAIRLMAGMGMGVAFLPALYIRSEIGETTRT
jgi:DNA-binding transcriptional LysR family regulator